MTSAIFDKKRSFVPRRKRQRGVFDQAPFALALPLPASAAEKLGREVCALLSDCKGCLIKPACPAGYHVSLAIMPEIRDDVRELFLDELALRLKQFKPFPGRVEGFSLKLQDSKAALWTSFHDSENQCQGLTTVIMSTAQDMHLPPPEPLEDLHVFLGFFKDIKSPEVLEQQCNGKKGTLTRFNIPGLASLEFGPHLCGPEPFVRSRRIDFISGEKA